MSPNCWLETNTEIQICRVIVPDIRGTQLLISDKKQNITLSVQYVSYFLLSVGLFPRPTCDILTAESYQFCFVNRLDKNN